MATLYVTEFSSQSQDGRGWPVAIPMQPALAVQALTIGAEVDSVAFQAGTRIVELHADTACHFEFGTAPTATTSKQRLEAGQVKHFGVPGGQSYKVSVIASA